ncbi:MAG: hypothetical protein D6B26_01260, partial [Spirochaetaceae bacterium]
MEFLFVNKLQKSCQYLAVLVFFGLLSPCLAPDISANEIRYLWRYTPGGIVPGPALLLSDQSSIVIYSDDQYLHILDSNGHLQHKTNMYGRPGRYFNIHGKQRVLASLIDGGLVLADIYEGILWRRRYHEIFATPLSQDNTGRGPLFSPVAAANGYIIVANKHGEVAALNPRGSLVWQFQLETSVSVQPVFWGGGCLVCDDDGQVWWFAWDGSRRLIASFGGRPLALARVADGLSAIAVEFFDGEKRQSGIALFDREGEIVWNMEIPASVHSIIPATGYGRFLAVQLHTEEGVHVWLPEASRLYSQKIQVSNAMAARDGTVYAATPTGVLLHIEPRSGLLWQGQVPGRMRLARISLLSNGILLTHEDRWTLHAFGASPASAPPPEMEFFELKPDADEQVLRGAMNNMRHLVSLLERTAERVLTKNIAGKVVAYSNGLLVIAAPESGVDPR